MSPDKSQKLPDRHLLTHRWIDKYEEYGMPVHIFNGALETSKYLYC
jgi:hypothetical protein